MLNRWIEEGLLDMLGESGIGCIAFSPLAQGMLTDKYLDGIPAGSRASREGSLTPGCSPSATSPTSGRSTRSPASAASRWRRWRWRGCCATRG